MSGQVSATMDFLGKLINFLILFGGLAIVLRKPLKAMLAKRTVDIGEAIRGAEGARAGAEIKAGESQAKMSGLEGEVRRLKTAAQEESRRETERIARAAAEEAERLKKFTRQELEEQVRRGVHELRTYAAARATDLARERIRRRLTPELQAVIIDKSIDRLSRLNEKTGPR
ncbi:MAG: ATP synthase F0 subunit B [Candidatus Aminicenantes bacterium]|nr:ATP synthase F0 subunit B [Candidatus Aminicenantes bacterium]